MNIQQNTIFESNKYATWYYSIIDSSLTRIQNKSEYIERHHIIPKSLGGSNDKSNLVSLTAKEHFICHALLCRMCINRDHYFKMLNAFQRMQTSNSDQKRYTSNLYQYFKEEISIAKSILMSGENNPFYGKTHTEESIIKILENRTDTRGANNPNFGNRNSDETKKLMSERRKAATTDITRALLSKARKGKSLTDDHKKKLSIAGTGRIVSNNTKLLLSMQKMASANPNFGKVYTEDERIKLSIARKGIRITDNKIKLAKIMKCLKACEIIITNGLDITSHNITLLKKQGILGKTHPKIDKIIENLGLIPISLDKIDRMRQNYQDLHEK